MIYIILFGSIYEFCYFKLIFLVLYSCSFVCFVDESIYDKSCNDRDLI